MIERPDITDEEISSALQENYSICARDIEFLPLGWDVSSWAYRIEAESRSYFLKIRKEISNPAGILVPRFLKEQVVEQVLAPLATTQGKSWATAHEFFLILFPFIAREQVKNVGMSDAHWVEFGCLLKKLHTTKLSPELLHQMRRESFVPQRLQWDKEIHTQVRSHRYKDPFQKELAAFWLDHYSTISTLLQRMESLAKKMQTTNLEFVLCHADIHTANLLLTEDDKLFVVDWDDTMLAPKERDLLFVMETVFVNTPGGTAQQLFFEGYGTPGVDLLALAYYRYNWCVEDMAVAEQIFTTENVGEETKRTAITRFKKMFEQGYSIQLALNTEIDF